MGLREQIRDDMKEAMKAKDSARLNALRMVQAAFKNREIELRPEAMSEDECLSVIKRQVKQRKESIEQYQAANRDDLVQAETAELKLLETYMPAQMGREQIEQIITQTIADLGAKTMKDMGGVIKEVIARTSGSADNKIVSEVVKARLQ
jgi:uncharacterized protein YqeY